MAEGVRTRRREPPEVRREQLLDAAAQVFLDRGLAQATIADVAEAAGLAKGTVYLYFDSKSVLLTALRARYTSQWLAQSGRLDAPPGRGGYRQQLRSFLGEMYDFCAGNQRLHHLLFHAAEVSEDEPLERARADLLRFVTRGAEAGEFTVDDPETTRVVPARRPPRAPAALPARQPQPPRLPRRRLAALRPPARHHALAGPPARKRSMARRWSPQDRPTARWKTPSSMVQAWDRMSQ